MFSYSFHNAFSVGDPNEVVKGVLHEKRGTPENRCTPFLLPVDRNRCSSPVRDRRAGHGPRPEHWGLQIINFADKTPFSTPTPPAARPSALPAGTRLNHRHPTAESPGAARFRRG